jgi:hypothetical protein
MAIYKLPSDKALIEFDYSFTAFKGEGPGVRLDHFHKLFQYNPGLEWFSISLA